MLANTEMPSENIQTALALQGALHVPCGVDGALVGVNEDFDAAVLRAAFNRSVGRDRHMRTVAVNRQARSRHAARLQIVGNRLGAVLRKRIVDCINLCCRCAR